MTEYFLTADESRLIAPLAATCAIEQSLKDRNYLRGLVRAYLGSAEVAEDAVLERCLRDPEYLASIARNYVASLDERVLLDMLRTTVGEAATAEQLGFDPFDPRRREVYRSAKRFINQRAQQVVLAVGAVALCLVCLFPPWKMERWQRQTWNPCSSGGCLPPPDKKLEVRFAGFRSAFAAEPILPLTNSRAPSNLPGNLPRNVQGNGNYNVYGNDTYVVYGCYYEMLLMEWLGLFGVVVGACAALRDYRSFEQRIAHMEALRPRRTRQE